MKRTVFGFQIISMVIVLGVSSRGVAQEDPSAQIISLNQKAMTAYQNMKIKEAVETLQEAEAICLQFGLVGHELALTYVNMGVVEAAGNQNDTSASDYFTRAVCVEKAIALDPLVSTPEVEGIFNAAKQKAQSPGTCTPNMIGGLEPPPPDSGAGMGAGGFGAPPPPPPGGYTGPVPQSPNVRHEAVREQAKMTPIPFYIEVEPGMPVDKVILFYRTAGESRYQQFLMASQGDGYSVSIGCNVLQTFNPTSIEYYINVMDETGMVVGSSGNEAQPHTISIVDNVSFPPPPVPGMAAPSKCVEECPPWNPNCNAGSCKQFGDLCDKNSECCKGMICKEQSCTPGESDDDDSGPFKAHFRMGFAFGTGGGYIPTDYAVPDNRVAEPPYQAWVNTTDNYGNFINQQACTDAGYGDMKQCFDETRKGLNIKGGMAWAKLQFRITPMVYLKEKLMIGLTFRGGLPLAKNSNMLPLSPLGLVTVGYRVVGKGKDRFELTVLGGLGGGLMYHKVSFPDCNPYATNPVNPGPWDLADADGVVCAASDINPYNEWVGPRTGNNYDQTYFRTAGYFVGEIGMDMYFWVVKNFGINLGIALDFLAAPNFAANGDAQLGVAFRL